VAGAEGVTGCAVRRSQAVTHAPRNHQTPSAPATARSELLEHEQTCPGPTTSRSIGRRTGRSAGGEEVRKLAEDSQHATGGIAALVAEMQAETLEVAAVVVAGAARAGARRHGCAAVGDRRALPLSLM